MPTLVLLRHGESDWNRENRFTGWTDVDLSPKGVEEAHEAARLLAAEGLTFDVAYTSLLKRAIRTLWIALDDLDLMWLPVHGSWRLNERHYGALQGLDKAETARQYGDEQVLIWRRSYDIPPPLLDPSDERFPGRDRRYADLAGRRPPARRVAQGHGGPLPAVLARRDRAGGPGRPAGAHRRPRQQPAGAGEVPGRRLGRGDRRAQHPDRRARWSTSSTTTSGRRATATWGTRPGSRRPSRR